MDGPTWYEIHVKSHLDDSLGPAFTGLTMRYETPGETILYGSLIDQAALHGVLMRIRDLGLPLLVVKCIDNNQQPAANDQQSTIKYQNEGVQRSKG